MHVWWVAVVVLVACGSSEPPRKPPPLVPVPDPIVVPRQPLPPFEIAAPTDAIVSIGRGDRHACVVRTSGAVDCWGQVERAKCEDCYVPPPPNPHVRRAPDVTDAIAISRDASCIVRRSGDVACLALDKFVFVPVKGIAHATAVDGPCAITGNSVQCIDRDGVVETVRLPDIVMVRATSVLGCVLRKSGDVWCGYPSEKWARVRGVDHVVDIAVSSSWDQMLCVTTKTSARCVRVNEPTSEPTILPELAGAHDLAMQFHIENHTPLEGVVDGKVIQVELNAVTPTSRTVPVLEDVAQHVIGCAVRKQGSVVCWGDNPGGVLAVPTTISQVHLPPTRVAALTDVADIAIGTTETFALTRAGQVFHWGGSSWRWQRGYPEELPLGLGPSLLVQIEALRSGQLCMRSAAGLIWCQGYGSSAIMRVDTSDIQRMAVGGDALYAIRANGYVERHGIGREEMGRDELVHATNVVDVAAVWDSPCFLKRDGSVRCPRVVPELQGASRLAMLDEVLCGLVKGKVACVKLGAAGAQEVPGIVDATELTSNRELACALHHGGRVTCWRFDDKGAIGKLEDVIASGAIRVKLGAGTEDQLSESHMLDGPAPGGALGCAIMTDRTMQCWGTNLRGELGDGSVIAVESPMGVAL